MTFERLLSVVADEPVFETALLLAGDADARDVRRQLSRWVAAVKLYQLRRGLYSLAPPYQKTVHTAFVRFPGLLWELGLSQQRGGVLAVKLEVDTNPPAGDAGLLTWGTFERLLA